MSEYILNNRELTLVGNDFSFSESVISFQQEDIPDMIYCVKKDAAPISAEWFLGHPCYVTIYEDEAGNQRSFLLIFDHNWVYTYLLRAKVDWYHRWEWFEKRPKLIQTADALYKKKKGLAADTPEEAMLKQVIEKLKEEEGSERFTFLDTHKRVKDPCQVIHAGDHRDKKMWEAFFEDIHYYGKKVPAGGLRYYPDLIVKLGEYNTRGNEKKWIFELELDVHNEQNFYYKLRKSRTTSSPLYFLFAEKAYPDNYNFLDKYIQKQYTRTFNPTYVATLESFLQDGMKSFTRIL